MSEKKNHNSLIFITTLSVYLGLVLVGSSPAVLAQAATTRVYDIKSEVVVEDDLDKKPDELSVDELAVVSNVDVVDIIGQFAEVLGKYERSGMLGQARSPISFGVSVENFATTNKTTETTNLRNEDLIEAFRQLSDQLALNPLRSLSEPISRDKSAAGRTSLLIKADDAALSVEISIQKRNARSATILAQELNRALERRIVVSDTSVQLGVLSSARVYTANNLVFITAALPRSAIDESAAR